MEDQPVYHNTTNSEGATLEKYEGKAKTQEQVILDYFKNNLGKLFTPFDILDKLFSDNVPITSIRRAMTNLEHKGQLVKTGLQEMGQYGKPNYCWRYKDVKPVQGSLF